MERRKQLRILLVPLMMFLGSAIVSSQTCRVPSGHTSKGARQYIEVYQYDYVTTKPEFPGGDVALMHFINETRVYPSKAYKRGVEGRVTCGFVINSDGKVSHIKVLRGVEQTLDAEAKRVFREMPAWHPGMVNGKAVPVRVVRSICFRR